MRKKLVSLLLATAMAAGMLTGCGNGSGGSGSASGESAGGDSGSGEYDLTLYSINTTDSDFDKWLSNVERGHRAEY